MKVVMLDSLVDNDYSICLCDALKGIGVDISLVVTANRHIATEPQFDVRFMAPSKEQGISKLKKLLQYVAYLRSVYRFVKRERAAAMHFQFFRRERLETFYFLLLRLLGVNVIYTAHNVLPHERSLIDSWLKGLVYRSARGIIVHSEFIRQKLLAAFPEARGKVFVIPHGNFDIYLPGRPISSQEARRDLALPASATVILCFGHIREYKGIDVLLEAFESAAAQQENLWLVIAGSARTELLKERYQQQIAASAFRERIVYHPAFIASGEVATYFYAADVIALPYRAIDHSGIVHLAYSFGRPIIATRVGDFEEVVEHGRSGYLVAKDDAVALASALLKAGSSGRLAEMGAYARHLNETRYSWADIAAKTLQAYTDCAVKKQEDIA